MPKEYPIRFSEEFVEGLANVWSQRVTDHIHKLVSLLPCNPELGSMDVRPILATAYDEGIRKLNVSTFQIVYRFDGKTVDVLALVPGPAIR